MIPELLLICLGLAVPSLGARLPYIIGGTDADITDFPWQCSLRLYGQHTCGASIISSTWLVTAAHCIGAGKTLYCGSTTPTDSPGGVGMGITQNIVHESYGSGAGFSPNDIAVLQVGEMSLDGVKMKAIPMWNSTDGEPAGNEDCWITGWGYTQVGGGAVAGTLQKAHITVYTNAACAGSWGSKINVGHVCIGDPVNGRGSCNGDSGGPLVCTKNGEYKLVGATSWGVVGCRPTLPSVYSRISYFRDWIKEKTGV